VFNVLKINVGNNKNSILQISHEEIKKYLGGKCLATKILLDYLNPGVNPFSEENIFMIMGGPLSGTIVPSMKCSVAVKSPLTGTISVGFMGGHIIKCIRDAGYLGLMIVGKCDKPSYVFVEDEEVKLLDASKFWGLNTFATEEELYLRHGRDVGIITIGPAGENLVPFSVVNTDFYRQAARGGPGSVLGSKKIKAIVVKGSGAKSPPVSDELFKLSKQIISDINANTSLFRFRKWGTTGSVLGSNSNSTLPTQNFSEQYFEKADQISGERGESLFWFKRRACFSCPVGCGHIGSVRGGSFKGAIVEGPEYETAAIMGSNLLIENISDLVYLNKLCDFWGLDTISTGAVLSFYAECLEKGLVKDELNISDNLWGNATLFGQLIELIAKREGVGKLLSLGVKEASKVFGPQTKKYAMHVKGLEMPGWGIHRAPGMAVAYITADRGADHQQAFPLSFEITSNLEKTSPQYIEHVAKIIFEHQNFNAMVNSVIGCDFTFGAIGMQNIIDLLKHSTGIEFHEGELLKIGELCVNLSKEFNEREGKEFIVGELPERYFSEPITQGPHSGAKIDREVFNKIKEKYLELRGW